MASAQEQDFKQVQHHPRYYISGGDVHFLVENQLFRVHRYFFERESSVFRERLHICSPEGDGDEGSGAIVLEVSASAFERLLGVFYNPKYSLFDWSIQDWTAVLELSHEWKFSEVYNLAIRELEKQAQIPLTERIALYQRFNVSQDLLVPLYGQLCSRPEALDDEEAEAIGIKSTLLIFRARESLRARPSDGGMSPLPAGLGDDEVHETLNNLLASTTSPTSRTVKGKQVDRSGQGWTFNGRNSNGRTGRPVGPSARNQNGSES